MDGLRDERSSPHSRGVCPLLGPLPCYPLRLHHIKEVGKDYADLMMPFGVLFMVQLAQRRLSQALKPPTGPHTMLRGPQTHLSDP